MSYELLFEINGGWQYEVIGPVGNIVRAWSRGTRKQVEAKAKEDDEKLKTLHDHRRHNYFTKCANIEGYGRG